VRSGNLSTIFYCNAAQCLYYEIRKSKQRKFVEQFGRAPTVASKRLERNNSKESGLKNLKEKYKKLKCWGLLASLDLRGCSPEHIRRPKKIRELIIGLCAFIKMKRFGEPMIKKFGNGDLFGYSAVQFIETSSITLHFDETQNRAFIEIFSCKFFSPQKAANFCRKFLGAGRTKLRYYLRY